MTLREILSGTSSWLRSHRYAENGRCAPVLADDGLLAADRDLEDEFGDVGGPAGEPVMGGPITAVERRESIERLQDGFNQLVDQLQQINDHLSRQVAQHEDLMARVKQLPPLLESLPSAVENQKHLTGQLLAHLQNTVARERQFSEAVERMPAEAARQTDTLVDINHQLAAAADIDVQMAESFNKFRVTLDRLNQNTMSNTEGILQMSRTFAASDRYLKYVIWRLNRRYAWTLAAAMSVCLGVVAALVGTVFYLAG
jgi:methyl-accepting chemotaxis protein